VVLLTGRHRGGRC